MTEQAPTLTRHDLEAKIVKHCWEDEAFRKEFLGDPTGTFVKYLKVPADSLPKISVHQEAPGSWHIVLPAKPAIASELSDEELERVAGGTVPTGGTASLAVSIIVTAIVSGGVTVSAAVTPGEGW